MAKNLMTSGLDKLMGRFMFRQVDTVVWDLSTGNMGVQTDDGIATVTGTGDDASITVNPFDDFGIAVPAFAQSTNISDVKVGDLIYTTGNANKARWVVEVIEKEDKARSFRTIDSGGNIARWNPPKVSVLGFDSGVMVVKSLGSLVGGEAGLNGLQGNLMPLLMLAQQGGSDLDIGKLLPFMLMQQMQGGNGGMGGMMQMLMFQQMMGQGNGLGNLFGGNTGTNRSTPFRS